MKQYILLSAALLMAAAGCQKTEVKTDITPIDDTKPVAVQFGLGQPEFDVAVKSAGSLEAWGTNALYVFGYQTDAAEYSEGETTTLIYNVKATTDKATGGTEQTLTVLDPESADGAGTEPFYYQGNNTYDFFGYYIDDAAATVEGTTWTPVAAGTDPTPTVVTTESATTPVSGVTLKKGVYIPFIINGAQDIMTAEADKSKDELNETSENNEVDAADCYSAYAARRGVQPNLQFAHELTRFTFEIKPGTDASKNVEVTGISIEANSKGFLGIAGEDKGTITALPFDETNNTLATFTLMERAAGSETCTALQPVSLTDATVGGETGVKAGESIMVIPGETSYNITIQTQMNADSGIAAEIADIEKVLTLAENAQFEAGKSYNVIITVYSLEEIEIKATLAAWEDGEDITIGQDDDQKPSAQN